MLFNLDKDSSVPSDTDLYIIAAKLVYRFGLSTNGIILNHIFYEQEVDSTTSLSSATRQLARKLEHILLEIRDSGIGQSYTTVPVRNDAGRWSGELWQLLLLLGHFWTCETSRLPRGPFHELELGGRPAAGSGAEFVYLAAKGAGLHFSYDEFREQFIAMRHELRDELGRDQVEHQLDDDD